MPRKPTKPQSPAPAGLRIGAPVIITGTGRGHILRLAGTPRAPRVVIRLDTGQIVTAQKNQIIIPQITTR